MADLRVLASGVDTLHVSARGTVRADVWDDLDMARNEAAAGEPAPVELGTRAMCLRSSLLAGGSTAVAAESGLRTDAGPQIRGSRPPWLRFTWAYLHSMGVSPAVRLVESTLRRAVLVGPGEVRASRIDLYADVQGPPCGSGH